MRKKLARWASEDEVVDTMTPLSKLTHKPSYLMNDAVSICFKISHRRGCHCDTFTSDNVTLSSCTYLSTHVFRDPPAFARWYYLLKFRNTVICIWKAKFDKTEARADRHCQTTSKMCRPRSCASVPSLTTLALKCIEATKRRRRLDELILKEEIEILISKITEVFSNTIEHCSAANPRFIMSLYIPWPIPLPRKQASRVNQDELYPDLSRLSIYRASFIPPKRPG